MSANVANRIIVHCPVPRRNTLSMHSLSDYDFHLPDELIANHPLADRSASKMLFVDRKAKRFADHAFRDLPSKLNKGDTLVLNNTAVFPARLIGTTETGGRAEVFLIREESANTWEALARPARRLHPGKLITFDDQLSGTVVRRTDSGRIIIEFDAEGDLFEHFNRIGKTPLPPYIKRDPDSADHDRDRYQTVYAATRGSIAAPTAGLHFTPEVLAELRAGGITIAEITLHVGYGTFEPVRADDLSQHRVLPEQYSISPETAETLNTAQHDKSRIVAVGTTTTRVLETLAARNVSIQPGSGWADLTVTPQHKFRSVGGLLTNFHLPKSSLLILVSAFGGYELIMEAYRHAVASSYRFYSYGDCMLIL